MNTSQLVTDINLLTMGMIVALNNLTQSGCWDWASVSREKEKFSTYAESLLGFFFLTWTWNLNQ